MQLPEATGLYRSILADQPDSSVTIVTVGFLSNLDDLLKSGPDEHSPLEGRDLVRAKVLQLVTMGGRFPEGGEFNIRIDSAASQYAIEHWPTKIIFTGGEIGPKILTGKQLINRNYKANPVKEVYRICMELGEPEGRPSWDQTAVVIAAFGVAPYFELTGGNCLVNDRGVTRWDYQGSGHEYVTFDAPPWQCREFIEYWMIQLPGSAGKE